MKIDITPLSAAYLTEWTLFVLMAIAFFLVGWNLRGWKMKRELGARALGSK